jgi:hypothetical protein
MVDAGLAPAPFTHELGLSADERASLRRRLDALGLRVLPYPFSSAMSVVSDCDASNRPRYEAYVAAFTRRGLDFGDSTWLQWNHMTDFDAGVGLGFFSCTYSRGLIHDERWMTLTRTFVESVAGYHAGNVDHFHSLLRDGPRVVIVDCEAADAGMIEISTGPFQKGGPWRTDDLYLFGLLVEGECQAAGVVENDGTETVGFRRLAAPFEHQALFALPFDPDAENRAPLLRAVRGVRLVGAHNVRRVILLSSHSELLLERVARLREFNVEISLITDHALLHFRSPREAAIRDRASRERLRDDQGPLGGVYGAIYDDAGLIVSTDADDPASVCRVLPELFDLGLRFLVPAASSSFDGLDLLEVVSPTPTRSGGGGYWARRILPLGVNPHPRTHQETFTLRMRKALEEADRSPGRIWPIYTHLGALERGPGSVGPPPPPEPYFDEADMHVLQDRALGLSGHGPRMWFTRASTLYDYCLIMRSICDHVERDGDAIDIRSWRDPALGKTLPCSPAQLYGVTFYVDDAATATVRLDGQVLETISRNPADETGRQSVTVFESEIRSILFDQLNPLENYPDEAEIVGDCTWRDGQLIVIGAVTIPLHGWSAPSAQALEFIAHGVFGVRLLTRAGAAFYFGDPRWADASDDACYAFLEQSADRYVVPFHDLKWRDSTVGHVPSHPLASITLMGEARFGNAAFLRPRATTLTRNSFCVAGRVPAFEPGQVVCLGERRENVDQRGWFCFPRTPRGIYRLSSNHHCDRRGPLVEVGSDVVNFVLDRPC